MGCLSVHRCALDVTFAQAVDSCEFAPQRTSCQSCAECSAQSAAILRLICASGHTSPFLSPLTSVVAAGHIAHVYRGIAQSFHSALQILAIHVRPPPSLEKSPVLCCS